VAYRDFKTISQVKTSFDLSISLVDLFPNIDRVEPSEYLRMTLKRNLKVAFDNDTEKAIENIYGAVISFPVDSELYSLRLLFEACLTYHTDATGIDITTGRLWRFLKLDDRTVSIDNEELVIEDAEDMNISKILAILTEPIKQLSIC
jgi:hypothetical protein